MKEGSSYHYSAADIQRYLQGSMTRAEMHALEKAALDDPFLADALEGYRDSGVHVENDMEELRARLAEKTARPSRVSWLTMVAAAALVISLSLAAWLFFSPTEKPIIAKLDNLEKKEPVTAMQATNEDSQKVHTDSKTAPASQGNTSAGNKSPAGPPPAAVNRGERPADNKSETGPTGAKQKEIAAADGSREKKEAETIDDQARVAAASAQKPEANAETGKAVLSPDRQPQAAGKARSIIGTLERTAQPLEGWAAFQSYLSKNLKAPSGKSAGLHGQVTISFLINKNGKPYDLRVERSLHPNYDAEAIRVLKEGPAWRPVSADSTARTTQIIEF